jgi:MinD superfamily P-loop ATPase
VILAVASGKGGTGKTMVATSLALSIPNAQFLDCDVEEPNGAIFLDPDFQTSLLAGIPTPQIDPEHCTLCGLCSAACQFNALAQSPTKVQFFAELCHGCGVCSFVCPKEGALREESRRLGEVSVGKATRKNSSSKENPLFVSQGKLDIGERLATPLIQAVKKTIRGDRTVVIDAPPGTSCPLVETVLGADYCLLVTEPTPFGLHDLQLTVEVMRLLSLSFGVILNRCDSGDQQVLDYCRKEDIPIWMKIPFRRDLAEAYSRGVPLIEADPGFKTLFQELVRRLRQEVSP